MSGAVTAEGGSQLALAHHALNSDRATDAVLHAAAVGGAQRHHDEGGARDRPLSCPAISRTEEPMAKRGPRAGASDGPPRVVVVVQAWSQAAHCQSCSMARAERWRERTGAMGWRVPQAGQPSVRSPSAEAPSAAGGRPAWHRPEQRLGGMGGPGAGWRRGGGGGEHGAGAFRAVWRSGGVGRSGAGRGGGPTGMAMADVETNAVAAAGAVALRRSRGTWQLRPARHVVAKEA